MEILTGDVIGCSMAVHRELGPGFLESVYQNALSYELEKKGINHSREKNLEVRYQNHVVGSFVADLLVEDCLILELKAVNNLITKHEVQLVNYLTATNIEIGLLLNFGTNSLQFKKKFRNYAPKNNPVQSC